jgi:predicted RNA-binding Zn-ribbon protein involved in translation (DUF1610 family)
LKRIGKKNETKNGVGVKTMSSSVDEIACPDCGGNARREQDNKDDSVYIYCLDCGYEYDSNDPDNEVEDE